MIDLPKYSLIFMAAILGILIISTITRILLQKRKPSKDYLELKQRIQSWWLMVALLFIVLTIGGNISVAFFAFLSFLALKEFLSIVPLRLSDRNAVFWAYLAIPIQYYWVSIGWYGMFIIFIPVYVFLFLPIRMVLIGDTKGFIRSIGLLHWASMLTVFSISHIAFLLVLPVKNLDAGNIGLVIYLLFFTQFNDVSQYIWGKSFGKHKIIPKVSPNKTWEGFIGGMLTITLCSGFVAPLLTPLNLTQGLMSGFLISVFGYFGDVVISSVKRDLQIKDTGKLIPGHGGILDRLDSIMYTAPIFFHYLYYLHY